MSASTEGSLEAIIEQLVVKQGLKQTVTWMASSTFNEDKRNSS